MRGDGVLRVIARLFVDGRCVLSDVMNLDVGSLRVDEPFSNDKLLQAETYTY
jgi:hypothetical protein